MGGRESLPLDPSGVLPSPLVLDDRLVTEPTGSGADGRQTPPAPFALLAVADKVFPRMRGAPRQDRSPGALARQCAK